VIEQAKRMPMLVYGLDDDAAFALLKWGSQTGNVKLRQVAEGIVEPFRQVGDSAVRSRSGFDHALLTAGQATGGDRTTAPAGN
jgi:hypothetical protein